MHFQTLYLINDEQMHDLLTKYFQGTISDSEKKELFSLMKNDAKLRALFISMQNASAMFAVLPAETDPANALRPLRRFKQECNRKRIYHLFKQLSGYAAAVVIAVLLTWTVMHEGKSAVNEKITIAYEEFVTPAGQRAMVKLYDGTVVWLNARTSIRYPNVFMGDERRVELNGEAYFEVAHDAEKPFVVSTERLDIKVLGTEFNVSAYKGRNEFSTSLVDGSLKIYNKNNENNALFVEPYEWVELVDNRLVKKHFDSMEFLLWKDGIYAFDDIRFLDIIKKLELYYETTIDVENKKLGIYKFTGKFRQRDGVESVLKTMQKISYFTYTKDDEKNIITIK